MYEKDIQKQVDLIRKHYKKENYDSLLRSFKLGLLGAGELPYKMEQLAGPTLISDDSFMVTLQDQNNNNYSVHFARRLDGTANAHYIYVDEDKEETKIKCPILKLKYYFSDWNYDLLIDSLRAGSTPLDFKWDSAPLGFGTDSIRVSLYLESQPELVYCVNVDSDESCNTFISKIDVYWRVLSDCTANEHITKDHSNDNLADSTTPEEKEEKQRVSLNIKSQKIRNFYYGCVFDVLSIKLKEDDEYIIHNHYIPKGFKRIKELEVVKPDYIQIALEDAEKFIYLVKFEDHTDHIKSFGGVVLVTHIKILNFMWDDMEKQKKRILNFYIGRNYEKCSKGLSSPEKARFIPHGFDWTHLAQNITWRNIEIILYDENLFKYSFILNETKEGKVIVNDFEVVIPQAPIEIKEDSSEGWTCLNSNKCIEYPYQEHRKHCKVLEYTEKLLKEESDEIEFLKIFYNERKDSIFPYLEVPNGFDLDMKEGVETESGAVFRVLCLKSHKTKNKYKVSMSQINWFEPNLINVIRDKVLNVGETSNNQERLRKEDNLPCIIEATRKEMNDIYDHYLLYGLGYTVPDDCQYRESRLLKDENFKELYLHSLRTDAEYTGAQYKVLFSRLDKSTDWYLSQVEVISGAIKGSIFSKIESISWDKADD